MAGTGSFVYLYLHTYAQFGSHVDCVLTAQKSVGKGWGGGSNRP